MHVCTARAEKAKAVFPRPVAGSLKPVVRGQTVKYNMKSRLGRGFTLEELKVRAGGWVCMGGRSAVAVSCCSPGFTPWLFSSE